MGRLKTQFVEGAGSGMVDSREYGHQDSRVKAVVAAVPVGRYRPGNTPHLPGFNGPPLCRQGSGARSPVARTHCGSDLFLVHGPRHGPGGGHLSILSPLPDELVRGLGVWAKDPAGSDRSSLTGIYKRIAGFFAGRLSP